MKNHKKVKESHPDLLDLIKIISVDTITRGDLKFKISCNNYDESILIFAYSERYQYSRIKHFLCINAARKWIDDLETATKIMSEHSLGNLKGV